MIHHINGKLIEKNPTYVIIECHGVGYHINISLHTYGQIGNNEACKLLTHLSIKEDAHTLYGFFTNNERQLFLQLISVNGVGTSTAQMILSSMPPEEVISCIANEDARSLQAVKGIGAKTAQRVIIDLKDKVGKIDTDSGVEITATSHNTQRNEALSALITLGFDRSKSNKVLDKLLKDNAETSLEELVKAALKMM